MATTITAGNATNGLAFSADNTGILAVKTGTGSGTTALTLDASQNATFAGTVTSTTGALYPLVSGTAWTYTSGTPASIDFTGIPSTAKRITVMINGLSYAAAGQGVVQIGSGSLTTTGYTSNTTAIAVAAINIGTQTNGFGSVGSSAAAATLNGMYIITSTTGNTWSYIQQLFRTTDQIATIGNGFIALGGVLDRLSLVATTSTFDAGTVNIMWE